MGEKAYLLWVGTDTRIRYYHRTVRGRVVEFLLQLEIETGGSWRGIIRYDTAHGVAHIDRFSLGGERRKERLDLDYRDALTKAERDLKTNWSVYRDRFLTGDLP